MKRVIMTLSALVSVFCIGCTDDNDTLEDAANVSTDPADGIAYVSTTPDGKSHIYVMNKNGANPVNLTKNNVGEIDPSWSPDGSQIAFGSNRDGNGEIYVMNADGTNPINLTNHPGADFNPSWSPDGSQVAFSSFRDASIEIYVMNANGTNPINLTNDNINLDSTPSWSP